MACGRAAVVTACLGLSLLLTGCDQASTGDEFLSSTVESPEPTTTGADGSSTNMSLTTMGTGPPGSTTTEPEAGPSSTGGSTTSGATESSTAADDGSITSTTSTSGAAESPGSGTSSRTKASDAQFLMHATFGPTRASLDELQATDHMPWIKQQMGLSPSLLRSRYRERANPAATSDKEPGVPRTPCEKGSRWQQVALSHDDIGKTIKATGSQLYVAGSFRTDLDPSHTMNGLSVPTSGSLVQFRKFTPKRRYRHSSFNSKNQMMF